MKPDLFREIWTFSCRLAYLIDQSQRLHIFLLEALLPPAISFTYAHKYGLVSVKFKSHVKSTNEPWRQVTSVSRVTESRMGTITCTQMQMDTSLETGHWARVYSFELERLESDSKGLSIDAGQTAKWFSCWEPTVKAVKVCGEQPS